VAIAYAIYVIYAIKIHPTGNELLNVNRSFVMMNNIAPYPGRIEKSILRPQNDINYKMSKKLLILFIN
jgi:hypothetical protein